MGEENILLPGLEGFVYKGPTYLKLDEKLKSNPLVYNLIQQNIVRRNNPTKEIISYVDANGNTLHTTNVAAGVLSPVDPLAELYVAGKVLDPAFKLAGRTVKLGISYTRKNLPISNWILWLYNKGRIILNDIPRKSYNYYRAVGRDAIIDAKKSGLIRGNNIRNVDPYPFFGRSMEPYHNTNYVIEGMPESADWISTYKYVYNEHPQIMKLPKIPDRDYSKAYETLIGKSEENGFLTTGGFDKEFLEGYEALPMTDGKLNNSLSKNFKYWRKYPIIGWRLHNFKLGGKIDLLLFLKKGNTIEERYIDDMAKRFAYGNSKPYYERDIASGLDEKTALKDAKEYMERYGDDEYAVFDFGTLPEVTIRPSEADKKSLAKLKRILPDKASRMDMYKIIDMYKMIDENINNNNPLVSQNESIDRLYEVYRKAKYPKVLSNRTIFNYLGSLYNKSKNWSRAMYSPFSNTINIPNSEKVKYDVSGLIPELAHAYQYYADDKSVSENNLNPWFNLPGDIKIKGKTGYERPGNAEHSAHSIIEPAILDYVVGRSEDIPSAITKHLSKYSHKQGGKMNILQFLKNGSGIHIKKENRGKFTDYCGGKVTSECIAKGKRSSNPAIRKRATFAANVRKWKHLSGGLINYAAEGDNSKNWFSKAGAWINKNLDTISNIAGTAMNGISSIVGSILKLKSANDLIKANNLKDLVSYEELMAKYLQEEMERLQKEEGQYPGINSSPIVNNYVAYLKALQKALAEMANLKNLTAEENAKIQQEALSDLTNSIMGTVGNLANTGIGLLANKFNNKAQTSQTTPSLATPTYLPYKYDMTAPFRKDFTLKI